MRFNRFIPEQVSNTCCEVLRRGLVGMQDYLEHHPVTEGVFYRFLTRNVLLAQQINDAYTSSMLMHTAAGEVMEILYVHQMVSLKKVTEIQSQFALSHSEDFYPWRFTEFTQRAQIKRKYRTIRAEQDSVPPVVVVPHLVRQLLTSVNFEDASLYTPEGMGRLGTVLKLAQETVNAHRRVSKVSVGYGIYNQCTDWRLARLVEQGQLSVLDAFALDAITNIDVRKSYSWDKDGYYTTPKEALFEAYQHVEPSQRGEVYTFIAQFVRQYDRNVFLDFEALVEMLGQGLDVGNTPFSLASPMVSVYQERTDDPADHWKSPSAVSHWQELSLMADDSKDQVEALYTMTLKGGAR
jgi:hypothetical protein